MLLDCSCRTRRKRRKKTSSPNPESEFFFSFAMNSRKERKKRLGFLFFLMFLSSFSSFLLTLEWKATIFKPQQSQAVYNARNEGVNIWQSRLAQLFPTEMNAENLNAIFKRHIIWDSDNNSLACTTSLGTRHKRAISREIYHLSPMYS
jgi:hypothetical protein